MKSLKFFSIFINLTLSILLSACGGVVEYSSDNDLFLRYKDTPSPNDFSATPTPTPINPKAIVGTWKLIIMNGDAPGDFEETLTFLDDSTCSIVTNSSSETCVYTFSDSKLKIISLSGVIEYFVQFDSGQMTLNTTTITKTYMFVVYW